MRARPHATVPPDWADRAYRVVNEWNHTRRFCKAYMGDPTERGQLPIYAEVQVPLGAGVHDALLMELLTCGAVDSAALRRLALRRGRAALTAGADGAPQPASSVLTRKLAARSRYSQSASSCSAGSSSRSTAWRMCRSHASRSASPTR